MSKKYVGFHDVVLLDNGFAKVSISGERFFLRDVERVSEINCVGTVDNELINMSEHGLSYNDKVLFKFEVQIK